MAETTQVNIRLSTALIHDLEFVAQNLKVSKIEWLKVKIAGIISQEREQILEEIDHKYEHGRMEDSEYKELIGLAPSDTLKESRKHAIILKEKRVQNSKEYFQNIAKTITRYQLKGDGKEFLKQYLENELKQLDNDEAVLELLKDLVKYQGTPVPMVEFVTEAEKKGISGNTLENIFENLKTKGYIKEKDGDIILTTKLK